MFFSYQAVNSREKQKYFSIKLLSVSYSFVLTSVGSSEALSY